MAFKISAKIDGAEKLVEILRKLPPVIARRCLRPALNMEGTRVLKAAKQNVPTQTKLLKKSLGKKTKTYPKTNAVVVIVGPRKGFAQVIDGKKRNPVMYAHLVEFGAKPHWLGKKKFLGISYGRKKNNYVPRMHPGSPAQKPMTKAAKASLVGAYTRIKARMSQELDKLVASGKYTLPSAESEDSES